MAGADFIIGNPPYVGNKRMRDALGDGYVDALREAYPRVPQSSDLVMYWWFRAARAVSEGVTVRSGLITTNSIRQPFNRAVVASARKDGVGVLWAVPDHPWTDEQDGADVRVSMTVLARAQTGARLAQVADNGSVVSTAHVASLNDDLTAHANVASASGESLRANAGVAAQGFIFGNAGFVVGRELADTLIRADQKYQAVIRRFIAGRDLTNRWREQFVIDFSSMSEAEARQFPLAFDHVRDHVWPERSTSKREVRVNYWWRFVEPNLTLRTHS